MVHGPQCPVEVLEVQPGGRRAHHRQELGFNLRNVGDAAGVPEERRLGRHWHGGEREQGEKDRDEECARQRQHGGLSLADGWTQCASRWRSDGSLYLYS
jgi:hypothetical protein